MPLTRSQAKMETEKLMELLLRKFDEQKVEQEERDRKQKEEQEQRDRKQKEEQEERDRKQEERDRKQKEEQEQRDRKQKEEQEERDRKQKKEQEERDRKQKEEQEERDRKQEERDKKQEDLLKTIKSDLKKENEDLIKTMKDDLKKENEDLIRTMKDDLLNLKNNLKKEQEERDRKQEERVLQLKEDLEKNQKQLMTNFEATVEEELGQVQKKIQELEMKVKRTPLHPDPGMQTMMKVKPPKFDGKEAWSTYLNQFEAAARGNRWDNEEKAINLKLSLRGEATEILRMVPSEDQLNFDVLVRTLEMRYGEAHLQQVYQAQLKSRRQQPEEGLQQFEADVARLVNLAYPSAPTEFREQISINCFIDGVRDPDTNHALRMAHHKSISEALAHGLEYEAAFQATRRQTRIRQIRTSESDLEDRLKKLESLLARKPKRPLQCWNCNEEGHLKRQCPKPLRDPRNQENFN
ncbi:trichohyalin-like [Anthonomus grandis grandis]|uniref:trichohyalin-like n=1 Tax=Anthonomus grandis grandis TaxID=2921223 RepID=UPI002166382E|nr:trichohyalin-like [Anthonomus grandis grandis]